METTATACVQDTSHPELDIVGASYTGTGRLSKRIEQACEQACQAIAPTWPLDQAIAVNPHFKRIGMPVRTVAARMAVLAAIKVFPDRAYMRHAWQQGRISSADLQQALRAVDTPAKQLTPQECIHALTCDATLSRLPLLMDVLDDDPQRHTRLAWRQAITHQISQTCAAYFDQHQAPWQPQRRGGLYAFWRDTLQQDHGIGLLMGLPDLGQVTHALPQTPQEARTWVIDRLGLPETVWADYLEAVLLTVNGWASWCAYLGWQARLEGRTDPHLSELLAIRLAWGALLLECKSNVSATHAFCAMKAQWQRAPKLLEQAANTLLVDEVWQTALELGYQRNLFRGLQHNIKGNPDANEKLTNDYASTSDIARSTTTEVQAVFCIDVRSEPMRRALESAWPAIQTLGFAGFFGLPAAYTPLGTAIRRAQLPGLLSPAIEMTDLFISPPEMPQDFDNTGAALTRVTTNPSRATEHAAQARQRRFAMLEPLHAATRWPSSAFSFVEAAGIGYLGKLGRWILPSAQQRANDDHAGMPARLRHMLRPSLTGLDIGTKVMLATQVLQSMGLHKHFAPMILLVGHASQSTNNAQASALDCGACCGQSGESNARALALLLNESAVRKGLLAQKIEIPAETVFLGALHNTTTDEIECFDEDLLPNISQERLDRLHTALSEAGHQVRIERSHSLDLSADSNEKILLTKYRRRANDGAQTRPEWGLAGNAAIVFAPRQRTRGLNLEGRVFLHDYDAIQDQDGALLEALMTAPMLVAHWINWQYHASTCDPEHLCSGNKLLHNVVGGHIGLFEGNGGDLRIGLSRQSLHDGKQWIHEPVRLTVVIEAPLSSIQKVIAKHALVQQLIGNKWLHLWQLSPDGELSNCAQQVDA